MATMVLQAAEARPYPPKTTRVPARIRGRASTFRGSEAHCAIRTLNSLRASGDKAGLVEAIDRILSGDLAAAWRPHELQALQAGEQLNANALAREVSSLLIEVARDETIDAGSRLRLLARAKSQASRTGLMLSGGGALGYHHAGVVRALLAEDLLPHVISGSSAGSFIAAILGTHRDDELEEILTADKLGDSERAGEELRVPRKLLDSAAVSAKIARLVPDLTFEEALDRSGRAIAISVVPSTVSPGPVLLSAATTPQVLVRSAVEASCAVPYVFDAVTLRMRGPDGVVEPYRPETRWIDGSVGADLPADALRAQFGVEQFIASQVNPVVLPYLRERSGEDGYVAAALHLASATAKMTVRGMMAVVRPAPRPTGLAFLMNAGSAVVCQDYLANINILPRQRLHSPRKILSSVPVSDVATYIQEGMCSTRRKIATIRTATALERALHQIGQHSMAYAGQVVAERSTARRRADIPEVRRDDSSKPVTSQVRQAILDCCRSAGRW